MNPYTNLINSEANILKAQFSQSQVLTHPGTKGSLREAYLRAFIKKLAPEGIEISGGFITDSKGVISPQIDLIAFDKTLPAIQLDQAVSIVPIECIRLWMEVKSTLKTEHLKEIKVRLDSISSMAWSLMRNTSPIEFQPSVLPFGLIVCYESDVAEKTVKNWLANNQSLIMVIVVGKYAMWNVTTDLSKNEIVRNKKSNEELLFLSAKILQVTIIYGRELDAIREKIASSPITATNEQIKKLFESESDHRDMVHYSLQSYFEA